MSDKESYNERMQNYFKQIELNIEDSRESINYSVKMIEILNRKVQCDTDYLNLATNEMSRAKENLIKWNQENPD